MDDLLGPYISEAALKELKEAFDTPIPSEEKSMFFYGKLSGQQEVIQFLKNRLAAIEQHQINRRTKINV